LARYICRTVALEVTFSAWLGESSEFLSFKSSCGPRTAVVIQRMPSDCTRLANIIKVFAVHYDEKDLSSGGFRIRKIGLLSHHRPWHIVILQRTRVESVVELRTGRAEEI
jgi:hypothetical protein